MAKIRFEGQEVALADDIAQDDAKLRAALVTAWPSISTAEISRTREDGVLVVSCAKKAGSKGGGPEVAARLEAAAERVNPALVLATELRLFEARAELTPAMVLRRGPEIRRAIEQGEAAQKRVQHAVERLRDLGGEPSRRVPEGF
ncbi:MAG: hypothetical protein U0166_00495 [Acidobacteriota bacterium]